MRSKGKTMFLFHKMILKEEEFLEIIHAEKYISYKQKVSRYL